MKYIALSCALLLSGCGSLPFSASKDPTPSANTAEAAIEEAPAERTAAASPATATKAPAAVIPSDSLGQLIHEFSWPDLQSQPLVAHWIQRYLDDKHGFLATMQRAEPYMSHISDRVRARSLPTELAFLPYVESSYLPTAKSWSGAAGLWQFMPATGHWLGLDQNWWIDQRLDPVAATEAALDYLEYLHGQFDADWLMALAAYNGGTGNIRKAQSNSGNSDADFWNLQLNPETSAYVPKLLAVVHLLKNADQYDIDLPQWQPQGELLAVEVSKQLDIVQLAEDAELASIVLPLNQHFLHQVTPPSGPHTLWIPAQYQHILTDAVSNQTAFSTSQWNRYQVRPGDNLGLIARNTGVTLRSLMEANQLSSTLIHPGDELLIPRGRVGLVALQRESAAVSVSAGDSLWTIARRYEVTVADLLRQNGLSANDYIHPGQVLQIPLTEDTGQLIHEVKTGESLIRIANRYGVELTSLLQWNALRSNDVIYPGDELTIWLKDS